MNASWRTTLLMQRCSSNSAGSSTLRMGRPSRTRNSPSNISPRISKQVRCQLPLRRSPIYSATVDPSDAQSWYLLRRAYMAGQKYNKAYKAYQQAVYCDGRNPTFWCSIGVLYFQINLFRPHWRRTSVVGLQTLRRDG